MKDERVTRAAQGKGICPFTLPQGRPQLGDKEEFNLILHRTSRAPIQMRHKADENMHGNDPTQMAII
jgi:hypothetical protein